MKKKSLAHEIQNTLQNGDRDDLVTLFVPSHARDHSPLNNQDIWAGEVLELFCELYGGGTSVRTFAGMYRSTEGETRGDNLTDIPILVQSYASRTDVEDIASIRILLQFVRRMRKEMNQECVLLLINDYRWFIGGET